jgi:hypothetical protein
MIGCSHAVPLPIYTLPFALQLRKMTENFSQNIRGVLGTARCVELVPRVGGLDWPAVRLPSSVDCEGFLTAICRRWCLQICRNKGFPATDNLESKLTVHALI